MWSELFVKAMAEPGMLAIGMVVVIILLAFVQWAFDGPTRRY